MDDHQAEHKTVPHCELVAKWIKEDEKMKPLEHTVDIQGTTEEKYFSINIDPGILACDYTLIYHELSTWSTDHTV